jgi:hypothetical protein
MAGSQVPQKTFGPNRHATKNGAKSPFAPRITRGAFRCSTRNGRFRPDVRCADPPLVANPFVRGEKARPLAPEMLVDHVVGPCRWTMSLSLLAAMYVDSERALRRMDQ